MQDGHFTFVISLNTININIQFPLGLHLDFFTDAYMHNQLNCISLSRVWISYEEISTLPGVIRLRSHSLQILLQELF